MESAAQNVRELTGTSLVDTVLPPSSVHHVASAKQASAIHYRCGKPGSSMQP